MREGLPYDPGFQPPAPVLPVHAVAPGGVRGRAVRMLVDTGADCTLMSPALVRALGLPRVDSLSVRGVTGRSVRAGVFAATLRVARREKIVRVVALGDESILGRDVLESLVLVLDGPRARLRASAPRAAMATRAKRRSR